jgi:hypothetical protein
MDKKNEKATQRKITVAQSIGVIDKAHMMVESLP